MVKDINSVVRVAIYARKSKFTGKGESIENQIAKCKKCILDRMELRNEGNRRKVEFVEYRDEGVSGKDMERPKMQEMLQAIRNGEIQILACYRLDRVSRSVKDFSDLLEMLEDMRVEFVSVNEAFDTGTPMGRAMLTISSTFAQLERETIAERIADNMSELAKTGRWLGGKTPLGFISEKEERLDELGKKRSRFRLVAVEEEVELVKIIYSKYLEFGSLTKEETYLLNRNILSRDGKAFGRYTLRGILTNPVYCVADARVYQFLQENGYGVYADYSLFDGEHGLIAYNKNNCKDKVQRVNEVKEWIVSVGEHEGIITSGMWIRVQKHIKKNASQSYRYPRKNGALLSGMLRCGNCGSCMRPKGGRTAKDGEVRYYYQCECKERSRGQKCQISNLSGNLVDGLVIDQILKLKEELVTEYSYLEKVLHKLEKVCYHDAEQNFAKRQMQDKEAQLERLLDALGRSQNEVTSELILKRIDEVNTQQERLQEQLEEAGKGNTIRINNFQCELLCEKLLAMDKETWKQLSPVRQKDILQKVIKEIVWDGEYATIHLQVEDEPGVKSA